MPRFRTGDGMVADLARGSFGASGSTVPEIQEEPRADISGIVEVMRSYVGMDLSYLRESTFQRRIRRRMTLLGMTSIETYASRLAGDAAEARALRQDTFIGVTGFFRDPEAFERLQERLEAELLRREDNAPLRIWVAACASGEEVYSIAILVLETLEKVGQNRAVKIFATDIDDESLAKASKASYPAANIVDIGAARVARYFDHQGDSVTVKPEIRELVIFAQHNLVTDPPFTKVDLVSCRNFLIYLEADAQESVLASLHFALRTNGLLLLGPAEALGRISGEFEVLDSKFKLFRKTREAVLPSMRRRVGMRDPVRTLERPTPRGADRSREFSLLQVVDAITEKEGRSAIVAALDGEVLETLADPLEVFRVPKGKPINDVVRIVIDALSPAVTTGLQRLRRGDSEANYTVDLGGAEPRRGRVSMCKLPSVGPVPERVLIVVEAISVRRSSKYVEQATLDEEATHRMGELQLELQQTRESLQATIEELQSSNEEQQSTNEELVASNEELQSTNEELQSVNEELFTVNIEYQSKIAELAVLAADLDNLLRSIDIGTLFLDAELRIRRFTPAMEQVIKLLEHDIGRPISQFAHNLGSDFLPDIQSVIQSGNLREREIRGARGNWLLLRILPYLTPAATRPSGVVITLVDVTPIRNAREMARLANDQLSHANHELSRQREELEDLFSIVAHDLKRPVGSLNGLLHLLQGSGGGLPESAAPPTGELLARAEAECQRMERMLSDLGHVSGITRRSVPREEVELQSWLDEIVSQFQEEAAKKEIRLNWTCDNASVRIARAAIEESLLNLIENALRYGTTGERPRVDVSCQVNQDVLEISVRDNGQGIALENHQKIFEPFRRLQPELCNGSGIGLVAARRLIAKLGGTVSLDSALGQGAKFTIRVPLLDRLRADARQRELQVLLVEDDALDAKSIVRALGESVQVTRVKEIAEADERLSNQYFDVVLLDLSLPDGHGFELVQKMRTDLGLEVPVVVITGHGEGVVPSAMSASISGYVPKSDLTRDTLHSSIASAIHRG
ncbi:MAG: CheR family methyltransferase [Candidatus Eisenbacteria bacterium]